MRTAGNNSLFQQPRSGGCLTLWRQGGQRAPDRASWQSGAQDFRDPLLFPPPAPPHLVCHPHPAEAGLLPPPGLWPPSPLPWQDLCPLHLSHTLPPASRRRPFSSEIWNPVSKARTLKPFDQPALSVAFNCPPRRSPPSPSVALSAGSPSSSLTSPAFQPSPMQFLPYLSHKIHFQKSLFPTPPRPPAPHPPAVQAPVYAVRHKAVSSTCPRGLKQGLGLTSWVLGPEKVPTGRADFTTGRERGKKRPRDH